MIRAFWIVSFYLFIFSRFSHDHRSFTVRTAVIKAELWSWRPGRHGDGGPRGLEDRVRGLHTATQAKHIPAFISFSHIPPCDNKKTIRFRATRNKYIVLLVF